MKLFNSTKISSGALALPFILFMWFACAADRAMDKTGIGDVAAFEFQSGLAGLFFWIDILVLIALLLILGLKFRINSLERSQLAYVCGIYVVAAPTLYFIAVFWSLW